MPVKPPRALSSQSSVRHTHRSNDLWAFVSELLLHLSFSWAHFEGWRYHLLFRLVLVGSVCCRVFCPRLWTSIRCQLLIADRFVIVFGSMFFLYFQAANEDIILIYATPWHTSRYHVAGAYVFYKAIWLAKVPMACQVCVGAIESLGCIINAHIAYQIIHKHPMPYWESIGVAAYYVAVTSVLPLLIPSSDDQRLLQQQRRQQQQASLSSAAMPTVQSTASPSQGWYSARLGAFGRDYHCLFRPGKAAAAVAASSSAAKLKAATPTATAAATMPEVDAAAAAVAIATMPLTLVADAVITQEVASPLMSEMSAQATKMLPAGKGSNHDSSMVSTVATIGDQVLRSSLEVLRDLIIAARHRPYISKSRICRVVTKIPHMEPEQLSSDYLKKLAVSFAAHTSCPMMIVGVAIRAGCVELCLDLISLAERGTVSADWDPITAGILDPAIWLQHLHVQPPPGTQVLSQACGSVWRSQWDETQSKWLLSHFPLPAAELPRILRAPAVLLHTSAGPVTATNQPTLTPRNTLSMSKSYFSQLYVQISRVGIRSDVHVRCRGRYLPITTSCYNFKGRASEAASQTVTVTLDSPMPRSGLLMIECKVGWMVSDSTPLLLTCDALLATEVEGILAQSTWAGPQGQCSQGKPGLPAGSLDREQLSENHDLIVDLGAWLDYVDCVVDSPQPRPRASAVAKSPLNAALTRLFDDDEAIDDGLSACSHAARLTSELGGIYHQPAMRQHMAQVGVSLLVLAVDNGCTHMAATILHGLRAVGHTREWVAAACSDESEGRVTLQQKQPQKHEQQHKQEQQEHHQSSPNSSKLPDEVGRRGPEHCSLFWTEVAGTGDGSDIASTEAAGRHTVRGCSNVAAIGQPVPESSIACHALPDCLRSTETDVTTSASRLNSGVQVQDSARGSLASLTTQPTITTSRTVGDMLVFAGSDMASENCSPKSCLTGLKGAVQNADAGQESDGEGTSASLKINHTTVTCEECNPSYSAYRLWLYRQNMHVTNQFFNVIMGVVAVVVMRQICLDGKVSNVGYGPTLFVLLHIVRAVGTRMNRAWFEKMSEHQNVIWHVCRCFVKVSALLGGPFVVAPPVPYLLQADYLAEGLLPTLCAQVRPSITIFYCTFDAIVSSGLYIKYSICGSTGAAIAAACSWNFACIVLSFLVEAYNFRSFQRFSHRQAGACPHATAKAKLE